MSTGPLAARRGWEFLLTPGPTNIPERIHRAMHRPAVDFSTRAFTDLAAGVLDDLRGLFGTEGRVFVYAANGHGAWEAAIANVLSPGDRVVIPDTGVFSQAWSKMAHRLGVVTDYLPGDWRRGADPQAIEDRLRADPEGGIRAVMMVHTDTSTGITSDVAAVRAAIDGARHPALLMVDTVASLATTAFPMDAWRVDVAVAASQKGLMLPPGLGLTAASTRALEAARSSTMRRHYWDWGLRQGEEGYLWFCGTAPEHLVFGLREALDMLAEEGLDAAIARHRRIAEATRACVGAWATGGGLELNALEPAQRADAVTCIATADGVDAEGLRTTCRERFRVALGGGFGPLHGRCLRIGHMGDINEPMILGALASIEAALAIGGVRHGSGVSAAVAHLAAALAPAPASDTVAEVAD